MSTAIVKTQYITADGTFESNATVDTDGRIVRNPSLAAAKSGSLTTRTNNTTGTLTMIAGHGITTGDEFDLYFLKTDGTRGYRLGVTAGTVATNDVPISGGTGDNLPDDEALVTAMIPSNQELAYDKDDIKAFIFDCSQPAQFAVYDATDTLLFSGSVDGTGDCYGWHADSGITSPFTADPSYMLVSHGYADSTIIPTAVAYID